MGTKKDGKPYFQHDYYARHDLKLSAFLAKHGAEGYGLYWILVETLYEERGSICLPIAKQLLSKYSDKEILDEMVEKYQLFEKHDAEITSKRILDFLKVRKIKSRLRAEIGRKGGLAKAKQKLSNCLAKANIIKESKVKESKVKENRENLHSYGDEGAIQLTVNEYRRLCQRWGRRNVDDYIQRVENWKLSKGGKYKNDYAGLRNWFASALAKGELKISWEDFRLPDFDSQDDYDKTIAKYT